MNLLAATTGGGVQSPNVPNLKARGWVHNQSEPTRTVGALIWGYWMS